MSVETDIAQHLASEMGLTYGFNIFAGPMRKPAGNLALPNAVQHQAVFCLQTSGMDSIPYCDGGLGTKEARYTVQVIVRSPVNDYTTGSKLADDVFAALDMNPPAGYFECRALASQPAYLMRDDLDHYLWSINCLVKEAI
jgi:hypothetical protein